MIVDDHPIAVWQKAPQTPSAVVLLVHGRTWSTRPDFDLQVPGHDVSLMDGLNARGIATYGIDLRGYGSTPRDESGWLTPSRAAGDVSAVLEWVAARHKNLDPPHVFGWSYGAMVAQLALQESPRAAHRLVLFGYPVRPGIIDEPSPRPEQPPRRATTAESAASDFLLPDAVHPDVVSGFVAAALRSDPVRTDWRALDQWNALDGALVANPTLLLQASEDPLARNNVHAKLFADLPNPDKAWVVIPGGDHAAFLETPRRYFLDVLAAFLTSPRLQPTETPR